MIFFILNGIKNNNNMKNRSPKTLEKYANFFNEIREIKVFHAQNMIKKYKISNNLVKAMMYFEVVKPLDKGFYQYTINSPIDTKSLNTFIDYIYELSNPVKKQLTVKECLAFLKTKNVNLICIFGEEKLISELKKEGYKILKPVTEYKEL
jgi:hypothetical protein